MSALDTCHNHDANSDPKSPEIVQWEWYTAYSQYEPKSGIPQKNKFQYYGGLYGITEGQWLDIEGCCA